MQQIMQVRDCLYLLDDLLYDTEEKKNRNCRIFYRLFSRNLRIQDVKIHASQASRGGSMEKNMDVEKS